MAVIPGRSCDNSAFVMQLRTEHWTIYEKSLGRTVFKCETYKTTRTCKLCGQTIAISDSSRRVAAATRPEP